jgi:hypothetical protein
VQSWDCTTRAFLPNSLRKFRERALFFPPLVTAIFPGLLI